MKVKRKRMEVNNREAGGVTNREMEDCPKKN
jgi:hypothetical protein